MPTISACLVVKDEAQTLVAAIESIKSIADEIVIGVDESCTDDTPIIARQYSSPGKLFTFKFENDFSTIRNKAIARAAGDWIFILDGHEFIPSDDHPVGAALARMRGKDESDRVPTSLATLQHLKKNGMAGDSLVCCVTCCMNTDPGGVPQLFFLQPRLFVNNGEIRYQNKVHNALTNYSREKTCAYRDILLVHNMPQAREESRKIQRKAMNASGLFKDVQDAYALEREWAETHDEPMPLAQKNGRPFFYMGNTYADQGDHKKAIYWYKQYLSRSAFGDEKYQALQQLAIMEHRVTGDTNQSFAYAQEAERLCYNRAEPCILRAEICITNGDHQQAIHWLDRAEQYPAPDTVMFLQGPVYSYMPAYQKSRCYFHLKDYASAIRELESVLTWRGGDPEIIKLIMEYRNLLRREQSKPNMIFVDRIGSFTDDIAKHYAGMQWNVVKEQGCNLQWKGWADIAWFEWCDANIVEWSHYDWGCPVICRLHSYEAYTDMPARVQWENVSHLVFVSDHIRQLVFDKFPDIPKRVNTSVIYNGVNPDKFTFKQHGPGRKVAFLGYINSKKSPETLIELARAYPEYEFHVGGQPQEPNIWDDFRFQLADLHNVWFHGWITDQNAWLDDMDYLVSTSVIESFGYTIAEAALKGIKPLVRHRIGAHDLWPEQWIWKGIGDFRRVLEGEYDSEFNRQWILDRYTLKKQIEQTDELVMNLLAQTKSSIRDEWRGSVIVGGLDMVTIGNSGIRSLSMPDDPDKSLVV